MAIQEQEIGLSIGGNMGDRMAHLRMATLEISKIPGVTLLAASPIYETEPVGVKEEYRDMPYLNAVLIVQSTLPLNDFSAAIHTIEGKLGRVRMDDRFAPRTIDVDILYAGDTIRAEDDLTLPHPRWAERRFVLQPLSDVRPDLIIPGSDRTVSAHVAALPTGSEAVHKLPDSLVS